jgi:hypothetical protein
MVVNCVLESYIYIKDSDLFNTFQSILSNQNLNLIFIWNNAKNHQILQVLSFVGKQSLKWAIE